MCPQESLFSQILGWGSPFSLHAILSTINRPPGPSHHHTIRNEPQVPCQNCLIKTHENECTKSNSVFFLKTKSSPLESHNTASKSLTDNAACKACHAILPCLQGREKIMGTRVKTTNLAKVKGKWRVPGFIGAAILKLLVRYSSTAATKTRGPNIYRRRLYSHHDQCGIFHSMKISSFQVQACNWKPKLKGRGEQKRTARHEETQVTGPSFTVPCRKVCLFFVAERTLVRAVELQRY